MALLYSRNQNTLLKTFVVVINYNFLYYVLIAHFTFVLGYVREPCPHITL